MGLIPCWTSPIGGRGLIQVGEVAGIRSRKAGASEQLRASSLHCPRYVPRARWYVCLARLHRGSASYGQCRSSAFKVQPLQHQEVLRDRYSYYFPEHYHVTYIRGASSSFYTAQKPTRRSRSRDLPSTKRYAAKVRFRCVSIQCL